MPDILKRQGDPVSPILPKNRLKFWPSIFLAASILFFLPASNAHPAQVTLAWDASTDPDIAGYKVYYGNSSGSHQAVIDVGNTTTCTISNLPDGTTYYFAATDYNTSDVESGYSNEVVYNPSPEPAPIPSHLPLNLTIPQADQERLASQRRLDVPGPPTAMPLG